MRPQSCGLQGVEREAATSWDISRAEGPGAMPSKAVRATHLMERT